MKFFMGKQEISEENKEKKENSFLGITMSNKQFFFSSAIFGTFALFGTVWHLSSLEKKQKIKQQNQSKKENKLIGFVKIFVVLFTIALFAFVTFRLTGSGKQYIPEKTTKEFSILRLKAIAFISFVVFNIWFFVFFVERKTNYHPIEKKVLVGASYLVWSLFCLFMTSVCLSFVTFHFSRKVFVMVWSIIMIIFIVCYITELVRNNMLF